MKRLILLLISSFLLAGCAMTPLQLEAEKAYYNAIMATKGTPQPLVEFQPVDQSKAMEFGNVGKITVYAPPDNANFQQYKQTDYAQPWIHLLGTVASVAAPWIGVSAIVHDVSSIMGSGTNTTSYAVGGANNSIRTIGDTNMSGTLNTSTLTAPNIIDNTSTPTVVNPLVVEQPAPIIVNPVVVDPVIVP